MKAAVYAHYGPPEVVHIEDLPTPVPADSQVRIKIRAASVAAGDWRMRRADPFAARLFNGLFRPRRVTILGFELAGEIDAVGQAVTGFKPGDQVFAACGMAFGAHAEYVCLPVKPDPQKGREIALTPSNLSYEEAAAVPVGATTALRFLRKAKIRKDIEVLIYGASGSVGTYAVQLAKYYGARVTAVCSTAHLDMVHSLGADRVIDYTRDSLAELAGRFELVFDAVGKLPKPLARSLPAPQGRFISVMTSAKGIPGDLAWLKEMIEAGQIRSVIDKVFPFNEIQSAHRYVEHGHKAGNVIVKIQ